MSYTVIARRYRPQTFDEMVGQEHITTTLKNAISEQKVSHAYLFAGSRGVGKTSLARILAKGLNCRTGPTVTPCNKCEICRGISDGTDPDVIEMDAASNRGIDEIRSLRENVGYVPLRARYKVYIIDEAHQLTRESFNALLKTLEEPPLHVKFILATTELNKLPDTIISRCQRFNFHRLTNQSIFIRLQQVCQQEKVKIAPAILSSVAQMAYGSMRDAESMLDQLISYAGQEISEKDLEILSGTVPQTEIFTLVEAINNGDFEKIVKVCRDVFIQGKNIALFLDQIIEHCRYLILVLIADKQSTLLDEEIVQSREQYFQQAKKFKPAGLLDYIDRLLEARQKLKDVSNPRILLELVLFKLSKLKESIAGGLNAEDTGRPDSPATSVVSDSAIKNKPLLTSRSEPVKPVPAESPAEVNEDSSTGLGGRQVSEIKKLWSDVLVHLKERSQKIYALVREGKFMKADAEELLVGFGKKHSFHRKLLDDLKYRQVIEESIEKVSGRKLSFATTEIPDEMVVEAIASGPSEADNQSRLNGINHSYEPLNRSEAAAGPDNIGVGGDKLNEVIQNSAVQKILTEFGGRVVKIEE